jgi:hypothetical protein
MILSATRFANAAIWTVFPKTGNCIFVPAFTVSLWWPSQSMTLIPSQCSQDSTLSANSRAAFEPCSVPFSEFMSALAVSLAAILVATSRILPFSQTTTHFADSMAAFGKPKTCLGILMSRAAMGSLATQLPVRKTA